MNGLTDYPAGATPLDPDELGGLKYKHITTRTELDELEQANIQSGMLWVARQKGDVLTDSFAIKLHKQLFGEVWQWAGTFRKTGKNIGIDPIHIPTQLRILMDNTQFWAKNKTFSAMETAIRFHHRLVQIHPFPNGNGRHSRIMADTVLSRTFGEKPIDWGGGHDLQKMTGRRTQYISALKAADNGDFGPLLEFAGSAS